LFLVLFLELLFVNNSINAAVVCAKLESVSAGELHTLALSDNNSLFACGDNGFKQSGRGSGVAGANSLKLVKGENGVGYFKDIVSYDAGWMHSLAADINGTLYAWGTDYEGQLGNGTNQIDWEFPQKVHGINNIGYLSDTNFIVYVSAGRSGTHSLAVDSSGYIYAWGNNGSGQCGDGTTSQRDVPVLVLDDDPQTNGVYLGEIAHIIQADAGIIHSIALDNDRHVWHWGNGSSTPTYPVKVRASSGFGGQPLSNIVQIASCSHSLAVDANGFVWEWTSSSNAYKVPGGQMGTTYLENIVEVSAGIDSSEDASSMARTADGRVLVWTVGQSPFYVPDGEMQTQSGYLENITSISYSNMGFNLAVSSDGRGWGWGRNFLGQLGVGDTVYRSEPALMDCAEISDSSGIIYVDKEATEGLDNGSSWDNAYIHFEDALYEAELLGTCEIWVANGTYKPPYEWPDYETSTFLIPPGDITIRGHFGGKDVNETSPDQRDFNNPVYETIFDGRVGPSGEKASYAVTCDDIGAGLVLDGFTFTGASNAGLYITSYSDPSIIRCKFNGNGSRGIFADSYSYPDIADCRFLENGSAGSGIFSDHSSWPYVRNCIFDGNNNNSYGLQGTYTEMLVEDCVIMRQRANGIYFSYSSPTIIDCLIENNTGDGINCSFCSYVEITDCNIYKNSSGIYCASSNVTITDCNIYKNNNNGIVVSSASVPIINNNKVYDNKNNGIYTNDCENIIIKNNWIYHNGDYVTDSGLFLQNSISPPFVRNNTIAGNAPYGIYVALGRDPCLINDIIWGNGDSVEKNIYSVRGLDGIEASYCCIEGGFAGTDNIDCDPCFRNSDINDFHLKYESECIDVGDPCTSYEDETDIDGQCRVIFGYSEERADIGADEFAPKADYNGDSIVNFLDFAQFISAWKSTNNPAISLGDDNDVDIYDLELFCEDWLWLAPCSPLYEILDGQSGGDSITNDVTDELNVSDDETSDIVTDEEPSGDDDTVVDEPVDEQEDSSIAGEGETAGIWLVYEGNTMPQYGEEITVYLHSDPLLFAMNTGIDVVGNAEITDAMKEADCNNFGWDNDWNSDPYIDPVAGLVVLNGVSWEGTVNGTIGYFKFRYYSGEVTVSIDGESAAYDPNCQPVLYSREPLIFGQDPNE
jgi:parallel beta-helix repeat protein